MLLLVRTISKHSKIALKILFSSKLTLIGNQAFNLRMLGIIIQNIKVSLRPSSSKLIVVYASNHEGK